MNRFNRWRKAGVWDRLLDAISKAYDDNIKLMPNRKKRPAFSAWPYRQRNAVERFFNKLKLSAL